MARTSRKKIAVLHSGVLISPDVDSLDFDLGFSVIGDPLVVIENTGGGGGGGGGISLSKQFVTGTVDGTNTAFTVATAISGVSFIVMAGNIFIDGIDYTIVGTNITYLTGAPGGPDLTGTTRHYLYYSGAATTPSPNFEIPTGSGATWTVQNVPAFIVINGRVYYENHGYSLSGLTITLDFTLYVGDFLISAYNSTEVLETITGDGSTTVFSLAHIPDFITSQGATYFAGLGYTLAVSTVTFDDAPLATDLVRGVSQTNLTVETPVGSGSVFNVTHLPVYIVVNGITYTSGHGYSYSSGTITLDTPLTVGWIRSLH
jgi:predicted heme/steroid binding protein